MQKKNYHKTFL